MLKVLFFTLLVVSCRPLSTSRLRDVEGGMESRPLQANNYLQPVAKAFAWTPDMTKFCLDTLPKKCQNSDAGTMIAMVVDGACKLFSPEDAKAQITKLGGMYAAYGTDFREAVKQEAQEIRKMQAAKPTGDAAGKIKAQSFAVIAALPQDDANWEDKVTPHQVGDEKFGLHTVNTHGVSKPAVDGIHIKLATEAAGQAFGGSKNMLRVSGIAALLKKGADASVTPKIFLFGKERYSKDFVAPKTEKDKNLFNSGEALKETLKFEIGPVPFSVTSSLSNVNKIGVGFTVFPTKLVFGLKPVGGFSLGWEGGVDIVVAKAGVDGVFVMYEADLVGEANGEVVQEGGAGVKRCVGSDISFDMKNILKGKLGAYAQVGWPDKKIFGIKAGWRGELTFVEIPGSNIKIPVSLNKGSCVPFLAKFL